MSTEPVKDANRLIQNIIDAQENIICIFEDAELILVNKAFNTFFSVNSLEQYTQEFGPFVNNFVPHNSYFHNEKVKEGEKWIEVIEQIEEKDRIVSMLNANYEPRAFSVGVDSSLSGYSVLTLSDISQDLIKRIMIENNVSIDEKSGAYNKEYFLHTSESFHDAAVFNEKSIGITMIEIDENGESGFLAKVVSCIKNRIRQDDMLVKYSESVLLLTYLVDSKENALQLSKKLSSVSQEESCKGLSIKMTVTLVQEQEKIGRAVTRSNALLAELEKKEIRLF